jgi:hypothetical protein
MFTLYCDDSGTHSTSKIAVAACLIAPADQWDRLNHDWKRANECEDFGVFHMADFVAKREQFSSPQWADQTKRDRTIRRLINIIQTRVQFAIACTVVKSAYDDVVAENIQHPFWTERKNHYTFAVRHCIGNIEQWRTAYHHREPIQYVFDRLSKGKGEINQQMELGATGGELALQAYGIQQGGWSFQDKAVVIQLQAADIWAWENYKYCLDSFLPEPSKQKPRRKSYQALLKVPHTVRLHNKESLARVVQRMRSDPRSE